MYKYGLTFSEQREFGHFSAGLCRFHYLEKNAVSSTHTKHAYKRLMSDAYIYNIIKYVFFM